MRPTVREATKQGADTVRCAFTSEEAAATLEGDGEEKGDAQKENKKQQTAITAALLTDLYR